MIEKNFRRIILVGKGASGKDHARETLTNLLGFKYGISYTTRPPRENEVDGKDYFFLSQEQFQTKIDNDEWFEYVPFNGWLYGTTNDQFYGDCSLFIMTPTGLSHLTEKDRSKSFVIYFDISEGIRRTRMLQRKGNADSVERRLEADELDFANFNDFDYCVTNPFYTEENLIDVIRKGMATKTVQITDYGKEVLQKK